MAEKGDAEAQGLLAWEYTYGKRKDPAQAFEWAKKAAAQADSKGEFILGRSYYNGLGVEKDVKEAVKWYRKAAEQEEVYAQMNLGLMYRDGEGVAKDEKEAVKWFRKAAEQGHEKAKAALKKLSP